MPFLIPCQSPKRGVTAQPLIASFQRVGRIKQRSVSGGTSNNPLDKPMCSYLELMDISSHNVRLRILLR